MADEPPPAALTAAFPPPPKYYTSFTTANLTALKALPAGAPIPPELEYLIPPPPPSGSYRAFGDNWTVPERHPSLEENGIRQLYANPLESTHEKEKSIDRARELLRLSKSLLLNYLELVGIMGVAPAEFQQKTSDLETILFNMHDLINKYRPHQSRETLCLEMEEQLERIRKETQESRDAVEKVETTLAELADMGKSGILGGNEEGGGGREEGVESVLGKARRRDEEAWNAIMAA